MQALLPGPVESNKGSSRQSILTQTGLEMSSVSCSAHSPADYWTEVAGGVVRALATHARGSEPHQQYHKNKPTKTESQSERTSSLPRSPLVDLYPSVKRIKNSTSFPHPSCRLPPSLSAPHLDLVEYSSSPVTGHLPSVLWEPRHCPILVCTS